eukprot:scaffold4455_cov132-Isochrysis_galbana.AAC.7
MPCAPGAGSWGRSACRASVACAACGCASGRRLQLERPAELRPPPARVPLARRRRPSLARYLLSCVWRFPRTRILSPSGGMRSIQITEFRPPRAFSPS